MYTHMQLFSVKLAHPEIELVDVVDSAFHFNASLSVFPLILIKKVVDRPERLIHVFFF